ncbi:MAG TPA: uroporphyrinogen-III C-methyltransferase [Streptosporangiaceae bacterium]
MAPYLLGLRLDDRRVVVVGGGRVAGRRVPALIEAGAAVVIVSPHVSPGLEDDAAAGRLRWEARAYAPGDLDGAWLVHACTDDPDVNAAVAADAERARVWCVRADDAASSPAWTPASGAVDDVRVGVLAGGDPRRAAGLRDVVVEGLRDGTMDARRGRRRPTGVAIVGGGPGDPGLITVRGRQLLSQADVVVCDRLAPRSLLDELAPDVEVVDAAKIPYGRAMAQEHINELLIERAKAGRFVVRLKGGDPFVFGRGGEEMLACAAAGVPVTVVPGVTSAVAGAAAADVPVTHRGVTQEFHVVSAHVAPDDERSTVDWRALGGGSGTLVILMAIERMSAIASALMRYGRAPGTPVIVVQDATLPSQRSLRTSLRDAAGELAAAGLRNPAIVVVGEVVDVAREIEGLRSGSGAVWTERIP